MNEFMTQNVVTMGAVLIVLLRLILALQTKYKKQAAEILLYLVSEAESQFGSGTGQLKYSAVSAWLYQQLPTAARIFLSQKTIDNLIESAVENMKAYLEINKKAAKAITGGRGMSKIVFNSLPVDAPLRITSKFGPRKTGISGASTNHKGILT